MSDPSRSTEEGSEAAWRAEVLSELGGAPFESLRSRLLEGLDVEPLYTSGPPARPAARRSTPGGPATGRTLVVTAVRGGAAEAIREELKGGADGVGVGPNDVSVALSVLGALPPREVPRVVVTDRAAPGTSDAACVVLDDPLAALVEGRGAAAAVDGAYDAIAGRGGRSLAVRTDPIHEAGGHAVLEIGLGLAIFAEHLRGLDARGLSAAEVSARTTVSVAVGPEVLQEVAKLRALRACLARLCDAASPGAPAPLPWIYGFSARRTHSVLDVPTNALRVALESVAALLSGVELWTPLPFDELEGASPRGQRFARLAPIVLREEGQLGRVVDPLGGAYAIESLTEALAAASWELFRELEREGGFRAAWADGTVKRRVDQSSRERAARVRARKLPLVGVSEYPDSATPSLGPGPAARPATALALARDAEPFERVRARAAGMSPPPSVFLAQLGPRAEHAARLEFSRGLFSVGGLRVLEGEPAAFAASGARVACLCGSDERYAAEAAAAARSLAGAGAGAVLLAGKPGAGEPDLRAAGVTGFVFLGCDVPRALEAALGAMGGAS